jgi:hypothetical protein
LRKLVPYFGFRPEIPLRSGKTDRTEIDMKLGDLMVEAKLTETDFQTAPTRMIKRYRDLEEVFDSGELMMSGDVVPGYQLIRGVLAAYATGGSFCVFCDARRPDLIENWYSVMRAVRSCVLRFRLQLLTWQELAALLPNSPQNVWHRNTAPCPESVALGPVTRRVCAPSMPWWLVIPPFLTYDLHKAKMSIG